MRNYLQRLHNWLNTKNQRELVILLIGTLIVITIFWYLLLLEPLWQTKAELKNRIGTTQQALKKLQQQLQILNNNSQQAPDPKLIQENAQLILQVTNINQELSQYKQQIVDPEQTLMALKSILTASQNLYLIKLENLPAVAVNTTANPNTTNAANKDNTNTSITSMVASTANVNEQLFNHTFIIEFHGDYFATLDYLQQLETLPWRIYWEALTYKVLNYPEADITLKLHILSNKENLINV